MISDLLEICFVTVTSRTKEHLIKGALDSALLFPRLVLALPEGGDDTIQLAVEAGADIFETHSPHGGMATWRNEILEIAAEMGYDWACMLDTDWRYHWNGLNLVEFLSSPETKDIVMVRTTEGGYVPAFFRLPFKGMFVGQVHEDLGPAETCEAPKVRIEELPKSPETMQARLHRDVECLQSQIQSNPRNMQWVYMLGESLARLGRLGGAVPQYLKAAEMAQEETMRAWMQFKAAELLREEGDLEEASAVATSAIWDCPGMAEPHWLLALISLDLRKPWHAISWAQKAVLFGMTSWGSGTSREGMALHRALFEGPYEAMAEAYAALGDTTAQQKCCIRAAAARQQKEMYLVSGIVPAV